MNWLLNISPYNIDKLHFPDTKFWKFESRFFSFLILTNISCEVTPSMSCLYDIYIEFLAYTVLQIRIIFADIKNVLECIELYEV